MNRYFIPNYINVTDVLNVLLQFDLKQIPLVLSQTNDIKLLY